VLMDRGRVVASGATSDLLDDRESPAAYLFQSEELG